jgi:hypothetical protein
MHPIYQQKEQPSGSYNTQNAPIQPSLVLCRKLPIQRWRKVA